MIKLIAVLCALQIAFGGVVTFVSLNRHQAADARFCAINTALVTFIDQSLAGTSKKLAEQYPTEYRRAYTLDAELVKTLVSLTPCALKYTVPPNVLDQKK